MQHKCQKMECNRKALGTRLRCVGKAVQNGGTFHSFCEAEKKFPNYYLKLMQEQEEYKSTNDICYLENICRSTHRYLLNVPRNRQMKAGIIYFKDFGEFYPPCPYRPQRIKSSSICKLLQITLSLI